MLVENWWEDSRKAIRWAFEDEFDLYCRLLAATSPMSAITTNVLAANKAYTQIRLNGKINPETYLHVHVVTLAKFLGENPKTMGRKVWSLYQNLVGNEMVVAVDRWMIRYYGIDPSHISMSQYDKIEKLITKEARRLGLSPAQRQIQIWVESRTAGSTRGSESYASVIYELGIHRDNLLRRLL